MSIFTSSEEHRVATPGSKTDEVQYCLLIKGTQDGFHCREITLSAGLLQNCKRLHSLGFLKIIE